MRVRPEDNLTTELARMGIPNPFAWLGIAKAENRRLFGRAYLGDMTVSDMVTVPNGQELYSRCAEGDDATTLNFDSDGRLSHRIRPRSGHVYAVVHSPNFSLFWQRLEAAIDLTVEGNAFITGDTFHDTYGIPAGAVEVPANSLPPSP